MYYFLDLKIFFFYFLNFFASGAIPGLSGRLFRSPFERIQDSLDLGSLTLAKNKICSRKAPNLFFLSNFIRIFVAIFGYCI